MAGDAAGEGEREVGAAACGEGGGEWRGEGGGLARRDGLARPQAGVAAAGGAAHAAEPTAQTADVTEAAAAAMVGLCCHVASPPYGSHDCSPYDSP